MLRKLRAMGTIDACQLAMVAAHLRLKAQQISVKTAMPRISHAMRVPLHARVGVPTGATSHAPRAHAWEALEARQRLGDVDDLDGGRAAEREEGGGSAQAVLDAVWSGDAAAVSSALATAFAPASSARAAVAWAVCSLMSEQTTVDPSVASFRAMA